MITIPKRVVDAIYRHAVAAYPSECCGVITGKKNDGASFEMSFPCRNLQDEMHVSDPQRFPRTSKTAYFLDPKDMLNIQKISRKKDQELKVIYHSHVEVGAYFSEEDKKQATYDSKPIFPGVLFLVIDITKNSVRGAKIFTWNAPSKNFDELSWEIAG